MLATPCYHSAQSNESRILAGILFGVFLLHVGLYVLWPQLKAMRKDELTQANSGSLIFLRQPDQVKLVARSPAMQAVTASSRQSRGMPASRQSAAISINDKAAVSDNQQAISPVEKESARPGVEAPVSRDTRDIFNSLKKDFQYRDKVSAKSAPAAMEKFGAAIQSSSTVMRESYKHEVHTLGDGRPVSKVITPFGTYCILHRKPGEIIGNELPTVPVTCGNL
ncbi:hypothetical protein ACO0LG_12820 [Undibacterium sp. Ji42W]|uniref:hypothetical protein n=1 Tax=Undibacterium sp. Ji42W TaxID=3413039 RepID=UPI003BF08A9D